MIWLNPLALTGMAAIVAPILIHILVQRRAPPFPFPTLRFLQPTRLAAIRRHVLEDLPLLLVRAAILVVAAGALAAPYLVTPARRAGWNDRIARVIVMARAPQLPDAPAPDRSAAPSGPPAAFQTTVEASDLLDGISRALAWLDTAPPARRELVVVAPFPLGSLTHADVGDVPAEVGIRLVRSGELPATRSFAGTAVLEGDFSSPNARPEPVEGRAAARGSSSSPRAEGVPAQALVGMSVRRRDRTTELIGPSTSVSEAPPTPATVPVEIVANAAVKRAAEATMAAVLSQRVPAPVPGRLARVVFERLGGAPPRSADPLRQGNEGPPKPSAKVEAFALRKPEGELAPWIADAIASLTIDGEVLSGASADSNTLVVTTGLPPTDPRTARLFRSIFDVLGRDGQSAPRTEEILAIPDADLRAWERPAGDLRAPRPHTIDTDDRRWWWAAALALLAIEAWMRRSRGERDERTGDVEAARVA